MFDKPKRSLDSKPTPFLFIFFFKFLIAFVLVPYMGYYT